MFTHENHGEPVRMRDDVSFLYVVEADLYRIGTSESPKLDKLRTSDIDTYEQNGILMVRADGRGISLFTENELAKRRFTGWLWKLPHGTELPSGAGFHKTTAATS